MTPWGYLILAAIALWVLLASLELVAVFAVPILVADALPLLLLMELLQFGIMSHFALPSYPQARVFH